MRIRLPLLVLALLVQLAVPVWMIAGQEYVLATGQRHLFRCEAVDPLDAFQGRYMRVRLAQDAVEEYPQDVRVGEWLFVRLAVGEDGFTRFEAATREPPADAPWVRLRSKGADAVSLSLEMPVERYFLPEGLTGADKVYAGAVAPGCVGAWVAVRVGHGRMAVENLYIGGVSVLELPRDRAWK